MERYLYQTVEHTVKGEDTPREALSALSKKTLKALSKKRLEKDSKKTPKKP